MNYENTEDKENMAPQKLDSQITENWRGNEANSNRVVFGSPTSPIPNKHDDSDIENEFFKDIIGSVFKTPDKPSAPVRHFDSLSPQRLPLAPASSYFTNPNAFSSKEVGQSSKAADNVMPIFPAFSPAKDEPLNTSFSKLLDLSGGSGGFGRFTEIDLNLSWPNLPNL